jgi:hypothetical protein
VPVCARAATEITKAMAGRNLMNLLVIGSLVLLEKCSETYQMSYRQRWVVAQGLPGLNFRCSRHSGKTGRF